MGFLGKWWSGLIRRSHVVVTVVVAVIVLAVIELASSPQNAASPSPSATAAVAAATVAHTATPLPTPTIAPTPVATPIAVAPAPTQSVLMTLSGDGVTSSQPFTASGDSVDVAYSFDCSAFGSQGNLVTDLVDANGVLVDELGNLGSAASASDSTTVDLANTTSPYHVEVNITWMCSWTVTVTGMPKLKRSFSTTDAGASGRSRTLPALTAQARDQAGNSSVTSCAMSVPVPSGTLSRVVGTDIIEPIPCVAPT